MVNVGWSGLRGSKAGDGPPQNSGAYTNTLAQPRPTVLSVIASSPYLPPNALGKAPTKPFKPIQTLPSLLRLS